MFRTTLIAAALAVAIAQPSLGAISVDGNLSDWGVSVKTGAVTSSHPNNILDPGNPPKFGATDYSGIDAVTTLYVIEDSDDVKTSNYFVGPNFGGQNYDGELLTVKIEGGYLKIAVLSGQRPDNGFSSFSMGDLRIITLPGQGDLPQVFGVESGGGAGGVAANGSILRDENNADGSFYTLNSNGVTTGHSVSRKAGELWRTNDGSSGNLGQHWYGDPIAPPEFTQLQLGIGGALLGMTDFVYTRNSTTDINGNTIDSNGSNKQHSVLEVAIPISLFGLRNNGEKFASVEWRPSCGNDELIIRPQGGFGPDPLPEPASLAVWGVLAAGALGWGWKQRRSKRSRELAGQ